MEIKITLPFCKCGCGKQVTNRTNKYLIGHQRKGKSPANKGKKSKKASVEKMVKTMKNKPECPFCLCGCGKRVKHYERKYLHGHQAKHRPYQLGLTKENSEIVMRQAESKIGRTKETHEGVLITSLKLTGRTKENNKGRRIAAKNQSIAMKKNFEDPEFRKKFGSWFTKKPNNIEKKLIKILENVVPKTFKYVGDFSFWIGSKNPDFVNENKKLIIEMFGEFWHSEKVTGIKKEDHEIVRINYFKKFEFETLIIWSDELKTKNRKNLENKILNFLRRSKYGKKES